MNFIISKELLEATINYLVTKPFNEVNQLVTLLTQCKPIEEKKESEKK